MNARTRSIVVVLVLLFASVLAVFAAGDKEAGKATKGQNIDTLVVAMGADARSLDPHATNDQPSARVMKLVYNRLMYQTEDLKIQNDLVDSYKAVSATVFEFKLKPNVKFHNGETLSSSDVKFTFERMIANKAPAAFLVAALDKVEIIDALNFRMVLKFPFGPFISHLAHTATSIVNEKAVKAAGADYGRNPVGTGPFKFVEWKAGDSITLAANDAYHLGAPRSKTIRFRFIPEDANRAIALETGEADIIYDVGPNDYNNLSAIPEIKAMRIAGLTTFYMGFNMAKKPFDNVKVRRAINMALDVETATRVSFEGFAVTAKGPLAPTVQFARTDLPGYKYNVAEAKKLLTEAGYPNGFTTSIWTNNNPIRVKYAEIFQEQLRQIGITCTIEIMEFAPYLDRTARGEHDMFMLGWVAVTGDADYGMYSLFHSSQFGDAGNRTFYKNPKVDELLDKGRTSVKPEDRKAAYAEAQKLVFEDAPWVFLAFREDLNATRNYVQGFVPHAAGHHNLYKVYNE
jgi:peptide/nickel transport system substrate-binding protein